MNQKFKQSLSRRVSVLLLVVFVAVGLSGCVRGLPFDEPPIVYQTNMMTQPKYKAQRKSEFFADGLAMRTPVAGTVAQGELRENTVYYTGKTPSGDTIVTAPVEITLTTLQRGQERYNIYCAPCHSRTGGAKDNAGRQINGLVVEHGYLPPTSLHDSRIKTSPDGHIYNVISNGIRNMPSYKHQISVSDRWAIVLYVRALQRSQSATLTDLPEGKRLELSNQ
ncbi:MAG: cytochrome c [Chloroherpetonaceae bacterium]|nr:cytochrome c [Chloroherpetonaceae bacterium]